MKKRKISFGFTLVELLTVIVVLGIILAIAIPNIIDIIENVRKEAFRATAQSIFSAGKYFYVHENEAQDFYYYDGVEFNADSKRLDYDGKKPKSGIVVLDNKGKVTLALHNGVYCATKASNEEYVSVAKTTLSNCSSYRIINTCDTWEQIAVKYDIDLNSLLELNNETDSGSSTCGRDIKLPITSDSIESEYVYSDEATNTEIYYKTYYTIGYINYVTPFSGSSYSYTIDLGSLPLSISDIHSVKVTANSVFSELDDFKRYIIKKNIGEVIWPGETPQEIDINNANVFKEHAATSSNMVSDQVNVSCNTTKCSATVQSTVNNLTNVTPYDLNGNKVVYMPIKFTVEFNGEPEFCALGTMSDTTPGVLSGAGTSASPYLIESMEDLVVLSNNVNGGNTYAGKYLSLTTTLSTNNPSSYVDANNTTYQDINGNGTAEGLLTELTTGSGFIPIGNNTKTFNGIFNGNTKCINNLYIKRASTDYVGLFGYNTGTITALNLKDINIQGQNNVGGLAGYAYGKNNYVTEGQITGSITGNDYVGLAVGYYYHYQSPSRVSSLIVEGNVTGNNYVGGIIGYAHNNYAYNQYIGGINKGGTIASTGTSIGRIIGAVGGGTSNIKINGIALNLTTVNGSTKVSSDPASIHGSDFANLSELNDINLVELALDTYIGGDNDGNGYYWDYDASGNVVLKNINTDPLTFALSGSGTTVAPYIINNYEELRQASLKQNVTYKLNANIDLTGKKFYMLGSYQNRFIGTFDGNTKTISNLSINAPHSAYVGFIGYNTGTLMTLILNNINIQANNYAGGLVGYSLNGNVVDNQVSGSITGNNYVGLAMGYLSHDYGSNSRLSSNMIEGNVIGNNYVGGLLGCLDINTGSYLVYITGVHKGGSIISIGSNVGRIYGSIMDNIWPEKVLVGSLALDTITVNSSKVSNTEPTSIHGADFANLSELNDINFAELALDTYIGGDNDNNGYYWDYDASGNVVRKHISTAPLTFALSGSGTIADPYLINNYDELRQASLKQNVTYKLNADIDLTSKRFYMLGSYQNRFTGTIDGNEKTTSNLSINAPHSAYVGFIGYNTGKATALILDNVNIQAGSYVGGLIGYSLNGNVIDNQVNGSITGNNYVGLAMGYLSHDYVSNSKLTSNIVEGNVIGNNYVGGLLGCLDINTGSYSLYISGINKGGSITSVGSNVGRIYGAIIDNIWPDTVLIGSLALNTITINSSTKISNDPASIHGADFANLSELNNINLVELALDTYIGGDNDGNGYYWDYDTNGNVVRKRVSSSPLTFALTGGGTTADPYLINNYDDLRQASLKQNVTYKLTTDIDLTDKKYYMLGSYQNRFSGAFNGNEKTINNININTPHASYIGLVGYNLGTITAVNLNNIYIQGDSYVGGLVGYNFKGNIVDNQVNGSITGNNYLGLAMGYLNNTSAAGSNSKLTSNIVSGDITGNNYIGGLVGCINSTTGSYWIYINDINKGGSITSVGSNVGRIVGGISGGWPERVSIGSLALDTVTINSSIISSSEPTSIQGATFTNLSELNNINFAELVLDTYIGGDNDGNGYYWDYDTNGNVVRKHISTSPLTFTLTGNGDAAAPYLINNYEELRQASLKPGSAFKLNADIDLTGKNFYMLGSYQNKFTGTFDGNTKTISNLSINASHSAYIGFIGYNSGKITALILNNVNIQAGSYVGGLVGCNVKGNVIDNKINGSITGNNYLGLAIGYINNTNDAGSNSKLVSNIVEGNVSGNNYVGGLVGCVNSTTGSYWSYTNSINKGGSITSVGSNVGRIVGGISGYWPERVSIGSLALNTVTINGSTVTSTNKASIHGADITSSDLALDTTYTGIGFNFTDEALDYIWYIDSGIAKFRAGTL